MPNNDVNYGIEICLNCKRPECNNCLSFGSAASIARSKNPPVEKKKPVSEEPIKPSKVHDIVNMWMLGCPIKDISHEVFLPRQTVLKVLQQKGYVSTKMKV